MARAIVLREHGGPETLKAEDVEVGAPGAGELRVRQTCLAVNFHDVYVRSGLYKTLPLPGVPGIEGVGVVEAVGGGVSGFTVGDRIAYITGKYGCYASERLLPAAIAVKLPASIDDRTAAASFLRGLTVEMLLRRVHDVKAGNWLLVHAAAGGVGTLLVQWAKHLGARVIGTAGSMEKADIARRAGCDEVILYRQEDFVERVQTITHGRGVDVAYDSVGRDTFAGSLQSLAFCGHLVNFGQASGPVEPITMTQLAARSLTVSRPILFHYATERGTLEAMTSSLFGALGAGWLHPEAPQEFPLEEAARAHAVLESRNSTRPVILTA